MKKPPSKENNIMKKITIITAILIAIGSSNALAGDSQQNGQQTTVNNYNITQTIDTKGLAAAFAAAQIHPNRNIKGIQIGVGLAKFHERTGVAIGGAYVIDGGMINMSFGREAGESFVGVGFNFDAKK